MNTKSEHIISLAKEIIDEIELSKYEAQSILLKCTRLARYVDNEEIRKWLRFEMQGFSSADPTSLKYMGLTGRWTDKAKNEGYWSALSQIETSLDAQKQKLQLTRIPDISGDKAYVTVSSIKNTMSEITSNITKLGGIKSKVISIAHDFATNVYYGCTFDKYAENIFDNYKNEIDMKLAASAGDILDRIPYVINGLSDSDSESISQALTTCRRIIDSFSDSVYPARATTTILDGNEISLKKDKVKNRINAYINDNCSSSSRKKRLRQNIDNLYERVSVGVHSDVTSSEAKSLFFNTYLVLGEVLTLADK